MCFLKKAINAEGEEKCSAALGFKKNSVLDCQAEVDVNADSSVQLIHGRIAGGGQPEPLKAWGGQMEYQVGESYPSLTHLNTIIP